VLDFPTRSSFVELAKRTALAAVYQLEGLAFSGEALARVKLGRRERAASVPTSKAPKCLHRRVFGMKPISR
jgi:hypothetical protein